MSERRSRTVVGRMEFLKFVVEFFAIIVKMLNSIEWQLFLWRASVKYIGNTKSGLYSVLGSKQVETVYCDFTIATDAAGKFTRLVYAKTNNNTYLNCTNVRFPEVDWLSGQKIKANIQYFYVYRKKQNMYTSAYPMPFDRTILNTGEAMNLGSRLEYSQRPSRERTSFTGHVQFQRTSSTINCLCVTIFHNSKEKATGQINEVNPIISFHIHPSVDHALEIQSHRLDTKCQQFSSSHWRHRSLTLIDPFPHKNKMLGVGNRNLNK